MTSTTMDSKSFAIVSTSFLFALARDVFANTPLYIAIKALRSA